MKYVWGAGDVSLAQLILVHYTSDNEEWGWVLYFFFNLAALALPANMLRFLWHF